MNLIQALKTGRPLRRPIPKHLGSGGDGWLGSEWIKQVLLYRAPTTPFSPTDHFSLITESDLLADDWEVEPKAVTITAADLAEAWKRAGAKLPSDTWNPGPGQIARELGLTDEE